MTCQQTGSWTFRVPNPVFQTRRRTCLSNRKRRNLVNILRFEMNVPTSVALESAEGVPVEGRYGNRMKFNLTDGRVMYVPPIVAGKIEAAGIVPGERFELCKSLVRTGQRARSNGCSSEPIPSMDVLPRPHWNTTCDVRSKWRTPAAPDLILRRSPLKRHRRLHLPATPQSATAMAARRSRLRTCPHRRSPSSSMHSKP